MDPDIGSARQGSPRPPRCHACGPPLKHAPGRLRIDLLRHRCYWARTVLGGGWSGAVRADTANTARCCPALSSASVRPVPADQVSPLVGAVLAHVIATPVCRSSKAMRAEATESCGRRPRTVQERYAQRVVGRVASRIRGSGPSRSLGMRGQRRTHTLLAAYGWKSAPKAPRIGPRVSPTPNASPVSVQLPMSPSGPSAS